MIQAIGAGLAAYGALQGIRNQGKDPGAKFRQAALDEIARIQTPDVNSMKIKLDELIQQGVITPEEAQAALVDTNAYEGINVDPGMRAAQMEALQGLQDVYQQGGLTAMDRSKIQQIQDEQSQFEKGQREAIMDNSRRRGVSGSGMEIAAQLMAQQEGANRAGRAGLDVAAMAQQRALEAMMQSGQLGGQIEDRSYGQQAQKAAAANEIAKFNASNMQQVNLTNTAARNSAQETNLREKQRVADSNTTARNLNRARDADLIQQNYQNQMDKAKAVAGAYSGQGAAADNRQAQNMSFYGGLTSLGGSLYGAAEDRKLKRDIYSQNKPAGQVSYMADGGRVEKVPGQAEVMGDDVENDKVPAMLSPGELVVPRTQADDVESMMNSMPRTENKPSVEAVKTLLQALTDMGC